MSTSSCIFNIKILLYAANVMAKREYSMVTVCCPGIYTTWYQLDITVKNAIHKVQFLPSFNCKSDGSQQYVYRSVAVLYFQACSKSWHAVKKIESLQSTTPCLMMQFYLLQGGDVTCEGRDDVKDFADIRSAMKVLMYSDEEIWDLWKILASLLHIGNITYRATTVDNIDASEITNKDCVNKAARLLEVQSQF